MKAIVSARMATLAATLLAVSAVAQGAGEIDEKAFKSNFQDAFPRTEITDIRPAADGLVEVELNGREIIYASDDGRLVFTGDVIELRDTGPVNLKEARYQKVRNAGLADLDPDALITYPAKGKEKAEIYAFTDITCGYCRKMHRHIEEYNDAGITVHYLAFPRGGPQAGSAEDMRHIWCDANPDEALTAAKLNNTISDSELAECAAAVDEQYQLGLEFGVRGTPAVYTAEGAQLGGYVTPQQLNQRLGL